MTGPSTSDRLITISSGPITAVIDPSWGMSVESLCLSGDELIVCDLARKEAGAAYGIPILFPTPNRVKGGSYSFDGRTIGAKMHGFVRHERFIIESITDSRVSALLGFDGSNPFFPYLGTFRVEIACDDGGITWSFEVTNTGEERFSWGLALHPFFSKQPGMEISVNVRGLMEAIGHYPTGAVLPIEEGPLDFSQRTAVDQLEIDSVFITDGPVDAAIVGHLHTIALTASDAFDHVVVYTRVGQPFLCIEPQTCSTDAHNLTLSGYGAEAGLIVTDPGEQSRCWVRFDLLKN